MGKIEIVENNIQACLADNSSADCFTYGNIPHNRYLGACRKYIGDVDYEDVIGLIDTTIFGGGERGLVFTQDGIYYRGMFDKPIYCSYENYLNFPDISDVYFDGAAVIELLEELHDAEEEETSGGGFLDGLFNIAGSLIKEAGNAYFQELEYQDRQENEQLLELLKSLKNIIKVVKSDLDEVEDFEDIETTDQLLDNFYLSFIITASYTGDREWYEEMVETDEQEDEETWEIRANGLSHLNEVINAGMEDRSSERDFVAYGAERYHHRMQVIYEIIRDAEEELDVEELYKRMQQAILDFRSVLNKANGIINEAIDDCYELLSDYDEE